MGIFYVVVVAAATGERPAVILLFFERLGEGVQAG
jgi:hypothetical protein